MASGLPGSLDRVRHSATLAVVVAVLAVHNVAGNLLAPDWGYLPLNLAVGGLLVVLVLRSGVSWRQIAGPRSTMRRGVLVGGALGLAAATAIWAGAAVEGMSDVFADDRVLGVGTVGLLYHTLIRIPLGTALFEEVAFRGVLPAAGRRITTPFGANVMSAALFGLWHVIPSTSVAAGNEAASGFATGAVIAGAVLATAVAGLAFSWLRDRFGLAAPVLLHALVNSAAFAVAWSAA